MQTHDDDLSTFAQVGTPTLPTLDVERHVEHDGARIWYAAVGSGSPVVLLHGGLGHSGNWSKQVPELVENGYRVVLVDSRGHGRSTRDAQPFQYERMASDVLAVMDELNLDRAALVGWSDGATIALIVAMKSPHRVSELFFFGSNVDPSGAREITRLTPILERCLSRHEKDYDRLSATPGHFKDFAAAVTEMMTSQPNYSAQDLSAISVPVTVAQSEFDEFIKPEHAQFVAANIPGAELVVLPGVSHFAPLQRPEVFNAVLLKFLAAHRAG